MWFAENVYNFMIKYSVDNIEQSVNYNYKHWGTRDKLQTVIKGTGSSKLNNALYANS